MAFILRALVSADRQRFKQGAYDLDLTYITQRIIAMGFPASGLEGTWRNDIDEVATMLKKFHPGKYMIWNLSDRPYDYTVFQDQVMEFGFPDHHAPPLLLLFKIMLSLYSWLKADPKNVAVVHCLGGKGRTGTVIGCYLILTGLFDDAKLALDYFANKRSSVSLGVTQPGQISTVEYFTKILQQNIIPYQKPFFLAKIVMYGVRPRPDAFRPIIKIYDVRKYPKKLIYSTDRPDEEENNVQRWSSEDLPRNAVVWKFPKHLLTVKGDVLVKAYHMPLGGGKKIYVFRFSFHTAFIEESGMLSLTKDDLSADKKFIAYHKPNFFMHLFFDKDEAAPAETQGNDATTQGEDAPTQQSEAPTQRNDTSTQQSDAITKQNAETPQGDDETTQDNETMEMYCKMFQKLYAERHNTKLDLLDLSLTKSTSNLSISSNSLSNSSTPITDSNTSTPSRTTPPQTPTAATSYRSTPFFPPTSPILPMLDSPPITPTITPSAPTSPTTLSSSVSISSPLSSSISMSFTDIPPPSPYLITKYENVLAMSFADIQPASPASKPHSTVISPFTNINNGAELNEDSFENSYAINLDD